MPKAGSGCQHYRPPPSDKPLAAYLARMLGSALCSSSECTAVTSPRAQACSVAALSDRFPATMRRKKTRHAYEVECGLSCGRALGIDRRAVLDHVGQDVHQFLSAVPLDGFLWRLASVSSGVRRRRGGQYRHATRDRTSCEEQSPRLPSTAKHRHWPLTAACS